jgi:hypothetical protein
MAETVIAAAGAATSDRFGAARAVMIESTTARAGRSVSIRVEVGASRGGAALIVSTIIRLGMSAGMIGGATTTALAAASTDAWIAMSVITIARVAKVVSISTRATTRAYIIAREGVLAAGETTSGLFGSCTGDLICVSLYYNGV